MLALVLAGAALALPTAAAATIHPQHGMSGVVLGMTKTQVQARLGRPIVGRGGLYYPRVWIGFRAGRATEISTTRRTERTASGIGVNSTEAAVRRAFPRAVCAPWAVHRRCRFGSGQPGTRATDFMIGRGRVLQVTISLLPG